MRAVILAGGKGRRLAPYTITFPKPLVPVGNMPILEIIINQLKNAGVTHITLAVGHLADLLKAYFENGEKWGIKIDYSREETPLGTTGPLLLIDDLPDDFIVMNGDVLTTINYRNLFNYHVASKSLLTIAAHRCNTKIDLGVIEFNGQMQITGYREKPTLPYDVSMGIYVLNKNILKDYNKNEYLDFPDVVQDMVENKSPTKVFLTDNEWLDIGRPDDYAIACEKFEELKDKFLQPFNQQQAAE